jgi:hypothetical protein
MALALGAAALGAMAFGAVAIGALAIGRARVRRLEISEVEIGRLRVREWVLPPAVDPGRHTEPAWEGERNRKARTGGIADAD